MTTKVQIYNEAIATAQANLDNSNPMTFEVAVPERALALGLTQPEFALFSMHARQSRGILLQLKQQDDTIAQAAANAKAAADKKSAQTAPAPQSAP